jgi:hypothetical protein
MAGDANGNRRIPAGRNGIDEYLEALMGIDAYLQAVME